MSKLLVLALPLALFACGGEKPDKPDESDTDTDADADTDTDTDADTDTDTLPDDTGEDDVEDAVVIEDAIESGGDRDRFAIDLIRDHYYVVYAEGGGEWGEPDPVIRIYDPSKTLIGENDDLPYRMFGTASGFFLRAAETGTYNFEVLEWSDWAGETPLGEPDWTYTLHIQPYTGSDGVIELNEDRNNDNDTLEQERLNVESVADPDVPEDEKAYSFSGDPWSWIAAGGYYYWFAAGDIGEGGDVDTFGLNVESPEDGYENGFVEFSFFPGMPTDIDPVFDLYDESGNLVATTDSPDARLQNIGMDWDAGIRFLVTEPGYYFLQVADSSSASGTNIWYAILATSGFFSESVTLHDLGSDDESDPTEDSQTLTFAEFQSGLYFGYPVGRMEEDADAWDSFAVSTGDDMGGMYLGARFATQGIGSTLDATVRVYDEAGDEVTSFEANDMYEDVPDDPSITAFQLPGSVGSTIYVVVENANDEYGQSAYYQGRITVSVDPIW